METPIFEKTFVELFAGVGLVGHALKSRGWTCLLANDLCPIKKKFWMQNGGDERTFLLEDVRKLKPGDIPTCSMLTASFPCVDFSTAGKREGFGGKQSNAVLCVLELIGKMPEQRRPPLLLFENVIGSICTGKTSAANDVTSGALVENLVSLGYPFVDMRVIDAAHFTSQSRKRVFTLAVRSTSSLSETARKHLRKPNQSEETVPTILLRYMQRHAGVSWFRVPVSKLPPLTSHILKDDIDATLPWTNCPGSPNLRDLFSEAQLTYARQNKERFGVFSFIVQTRAGRPTGEILRNGKAYCLRTGTGRLQAAILGFDSENRLQVRYLHEKECAALQGVPEFQFGQVAPRHCYKAMGDAVCVPVVAWLIDHVVEPLLRLRSRQD